MNPHLERIGSFIEQLDQDLQSALENATEMQNFGKGDYLLRAGNICSKSFLLVEGVARKFYVTQDGKEVTTEFFFKDDLAVSFQSYTLQKASLEFIQALEET